jgi:aerobic carbon-monoxide dehydrogenase medium subunit
VSPFQYLRPSSIDAAASALLAGDGESKALAGGMTLIPSMKHGLIAPSMLVDLREIQALRRIELEQDLLVLGAMRTHHDVASSPLVQRHLPALAKLAGGIGDAQVRYRGTIGGSIANNDPAADYPAACLALDATIVTSKRELRAAEFFTGFFATALLDGELIIAVRFPTPAKGHYAKFASQASRYATVGVFVAQTTAGVRVAVTGAGQQGVLRVPVLEAALSRSFEPESLPAHGIPEHDLVSDLHASSAYRSHLINVMTRRAVATCLGRETRSIERHGGATEM